MPVSISMMQLYPNPAQVKPSAAPEYESFVNGKHVGFRKKEVASPIRAFGLLAVTGIIIWGMCVYADKKAEEHL